ncbi:hypothetical protein Poli38472_014601 [Pythium oligandrum]|uniref:Uncharacterized protein n=1 Tax=Pythium oligandrum TaxID=41045 RepID=A0A8K1CNJ9_PYTOL|nr:hypothetical protein Poli38472_014601 [Pythium oligandrum]|eukprot:TMW66625.1 hypothetical protein Poli38472_014601 [Pythium oligandrum]
MITAYHVSTQDNLRTIKRTVCDDSNRDGLLFRAKVASFTTTKWKGELPDFSPYPRSFAEGEYGSRYRMEFDPADFKKFFMADTDRDGVRQVHFLLLEKSKSLEKELAKKVRALLKKRKWEYNRWDEFFPKGNANDYSWDSPSYVGKVFVNVMFWHDVKLKKADKVVKRGLTYTIEPPVTALSTKEWLNTLRVEESSDESDEEPDSENDGVDVITSGLNSQNLSD